ncbi:MAG: hypothetical protein IJ700_01970 [Bacteroidaceae bacterium]|nr:hypothetical protein [Bacteroidaceae bacterium]MBR1755018.1 hypothetical protein [Bacteroidaceae bacterium]
MRTLTYLLIFLFVSLMLAVIPKAGGYVWDPRIIVPATAAMFTLLVWLVARFIGTDRTPVELVITAAFILLFAPGSTLFFSRDEDAIIELGSQCIVPFFLTQYTRISRKNFKSAYALMLLMGIFCSFTHDGITLPLCLAFLLLAWQRRDEFFRLACWPMVAGWLVGTVLQFLTRDHLPDLTPDIETLTSRTAMVLTLLWDTKVFMLAVGLTVWFTTTSWGRRELRFAFRRNRLITYSLLFALSCVPFAPLGIDNAVTGVCFFAMLWAMLLCKGLEHHFFGAARVRRS